MDDQGLLSEAPRRPVDLRPSQATRRGTSSLGADDMRRHLTSPSPASPMDLDDLLTEILLRLPPLPSSLPRASLVCTRWRRLVTDPSFIRRFRAHHWRPLGVFFGSDDQSLSFRLHVVSAAFDSLSTGGLGNVMVGNTLYWILFGSQVHILQLDLGTQHLAVIEVPASAYEDHYGTYLCTLAEGGGPSLIVMLADLRAQLWVWERTADDSEVVVLDGCVDEPLS